MSIFGIFRHDWESPDPKKRAKALLNLDDSYQEVFAERAANDTDKAVRIEALRKLGDLELLRKCSTADADEAVRKVALTRLHEEIAKVLKAFKGEVTNAELSLAAEIAETPLAEDVYKALTNPKLRLSLIGRATKNALLANAALRDMNDKVSQLAAERLESETSLREVAENSRHTSVRKFAAEKLKAKAAAGEKKESSEEILNLKRSALLKQAERLCESWAVLDDRATFEELLKTAEELGMGESAAKLEELKASFEAKVSEALVKKAKAEEERRAEEEKVRQRDQLLADLDAVLSGPKSEESHTRAQELLKQAKAASAEADLNWNTKYQKLSYRFEKIFSNMPEREAKPAEPEVDEAAADSRDSLIAKLSALVETEIDDFTEKALHNIVRAWEALPLLEGEDAELQTYNSLRTRLNEKFDAWREASKRIFEEKSAELKKLIEEVRNLDDETMDFTKISQTLKSTLNRWNEIVGEEKPKFQDLKNEFWEVRSKFQEVLKWETWHNEQGRNAILQELETFVNEAPSEELLEKTKRAISQWKASGPVSSARLQDYRTRYKAAVDKIFENCASILEARREESEENLRKKEALCERVEALAADASVQDKEKSKALKQIQEEWKAIGKVPREKVQEIWDRFRKAADEIHGQHKVALEQENVRRQGNYEKKVGLCEQAEALQESEDWNEAAAAIKKLQEEWKASGPVPRNVSDEIWNRFRAACDKFFERRRAHFQAMDQVKKENLEKKQALCEKLEKLASDATEEALNAVAEEWKQIGLVPKEALEGLNARYMKAVDAATALMAQADSKLAERLEAVKNRKQEIVATVNELSDKAGLASIAEQVRDLQAEWRNLGSCGEGEHDLFKAFHDACDEFFGRRRDQMEIQEEARKNNLQKKLMLCEQAERLSEAEGESLYDLTNQAKQLRRLWKEIGPVPRDQSDKIWKRFNQACDAVFAKAHPHQEKQG